MILSAPAPRSSGLLLRHVWSNDIETDGSEMNGPLAQLVALTCHGNAFLQGAPVDRIFPENSTFTFCDRVSFVTIEKPFLGTPREQDVAATPEGWFEFLGSAGAAGIRLTRKPQNHPQISDRMSAGLVGGGGTWAMEVLLPRHRSAFWVARWEVWNQDAPEQRIWRVTYGRVSEGATKQSNPEDLQGTTTRLTRTLRDIHSFSAQHECVGFTECFADALDTLDSDGRNLHGYHRDLAPAGHLSDRARALLDASQRAWVFGGMGSWNDMGFDGEAQKEYERLSEKLFQTLNRAIAEAANQSFQRCS